MVNLLLFTDLHLDKESLEECSSILDEILSLSEEYKADAIINLGDTFDKLHPGSEELDLFSSFIKRFNKPIIIIAADSHESESKEISILNHFTLLNDNIKVVKQYDDKGYFFGHFYTKEVNPFGTTKTKEDLKKYSKSFLGHWHGRYLIKSPYIYFPGSCRFVSFSEIEDLQKGVIIFMDYQGANERIEWVALKSPIPMRLLELQEKSGKNIEKTTIKDTKSDNKPKTTSTTTPKKSLSFGEGVKWLDSIPPKTKVKVKIMDFESYKQFLLVEQKYKDKFIKFVRENNFEIMSQVSSSKKKDSENLEQSFARFAKEKNVDEEIQGIIKKKIKDGT
jgi:DNA repair exonuclease SbcCD nuclease subunit